MNEGTDLNASVIRSGMMDSKVSGEAEDLTI